MICNVPPASTTVLERTVVVSLSTLDPALVSGLNFAGRFWNVAVAGTVMTVVKGKFVGLVMRTVQFVGRV